MIQESLPERLRHFVNRTAQINAFRQMGLDPTDWVLVFYGLSGNGKTKLVEYVVETECVRASVPYMYVNLDGRSFRSKYNALLEELITSRGLTSHLPKSALKDYHNRTRAVLAGRNESRNTFVQLSIGGRNITQTINAELASDIRPIDTSTQISITSEWLDTLERLEDRRIVIFLDSYEAYSGKRLESWLWEQVLIPAHKRRQGLIVVVCTSRDDLSLPGVSVRKAEVKELSQDESAELLHRLKIDDPAFASAVYQHIANGHPLLTEMAAAAWKPNERGEAIEEVARRGQSHKWVYGRIINRLPKPFNEIARWAGLLRQFNAESLAAILDIQLTDDQFQRLTSFAFVRPASPGWAIHDLVRKTQRPYLETTWPEKFRSIHQRASNYHATRGEVIDDLYHRFFLDLNEAFIAWQLEQDRAESGGDYEMFGQLLDLVELQEVPKTLLMTALIADRRGSWLHEYLADDDGAVEKFELAFAILSDELGETSDTATTMNNLGLVLHERGNGELGDLDRAQTLYEGALRIWKATKGDESLEVGEAVNNLGYLLHDRGDFQGARELLEEVVALWTRLLGPDDPKSLTALSNLAILLHDQGDSVTAKAHLLHILEAREKLLGPNHPDVAKSLNNLATTIFGLNELEDARKYFFRALAIDERVYGREHPSTATTLNNYGMILHIEGVNGKDREKLEEAKRVYENVLAIRKKFFGLWNADVATALHNLGAVHKALADMDRNLAREYSEQAREIRKRILHPDHFHLAYSLNQLGLIAQEEGNYDEAETLLDQAFRIRQTRNGPGHVDTLKSRDRLGRLYVDRGKRDQAIQLYLEALEVAERVLGNDHPVCEVIREHLARIRRNE